MIMSYLNYKILEAYAINLVKLNKATTKLNFS